MARLRAEIDVDESRWSELSDALRDAAANVLGADVLGSAIQIGTPEQASEMMGRKAIEVVRSFLSHMEARDLEAARQLLDNDFLMVFPGGKTMTSLEELVAWSKPRYRFVRKTYAAWDASHAETHEVIHCHGTLSGEWTDGTPFEGIRFIDRFEVSKGRILKQDVWNDMGEARKESPR